MDEPFGALDPLVRADLQRQLRRIQKSLGTTILFVTHDIDEAIYMGSRVLVMEAKPGRIKKDIKIDLPYPRKRSGPKFVEYRNQILELLDYGSGEKTA